MGMIFLIISFFCSVSHISIKQPLPANGRTNENLVWLYRYKHKPEKLFPLQAPVFEFKNGKINAAIASDSHEILEINGINPLWLKDTLIKRASIKVLLIKANGTWTTRLASQPCELQIICPGNVPGNPINIHVRTTLYARGKSSYKTESRLIGKVPSVQQHISN